IFEEFFDMDLPVGKFSEKDTDFLLFASPTKVNVDGVNLTFEGLIPKMKKTMLQKDRSTMQPHIRAFVDRAVTFTVCPECEGTRLNDLARSSKIHGQSIADLARMQISDLAHWIDDLDDNRVGPLLNAISTTLQAFTNIGLGYLTLDRDSGSLSGGEAQRTKMIRHLGSSL